MKFASSSRPLRAARGSVLITALILTIAVGMVLASHLSLSRQALKTSNRTVYTTAAVGLAETGLEQAMWALNAAGRGESGAWDGWTVSGGDASRDFDGFSFGAGASGNVRVRVIGHTGDTPEIVARATVTLATDGPEIEKWLKLTVANAAGATAPNPARSLFAYGLLARESLYANGGAWFDSWPSDPDNDPSTPAVPWSQAVARDNTKLAVAATTNGAMWIDGADVYGTVAVGAGTAAGLKMKDWDGQIGPRGSSFSGKYRVVPGTVSVDFGATYETVNEPADPTVRAPYVLPRSVSGPPWYLSAESLGTTGETTVLQMNKLTVEGAATLTIKGDVTLFLPPSGAETMKVAGSGKILLEDNATLTIYTPGNINVSGAGIANSGAPARVQIWSTRNGTTGQTISLAGSASLNAVIYAPDAALTLPGHTDFCGAAVVRTARLTGSGAFHYDESLQFFSGGGSRPDANGSDAVGGVLAIEKFEELTTPQSRAPYLATLGF